MRFFLQGVRGELEAAINEIQKPIAQAATAAVAEAAEIAKNEGRADIARAGFSKRWQNALRSDLFPKRGVSMRPAALVRHKIPYAHVFEEGATLRGKPLLWLPLDTVPLGRGGKPLTPKQFVQRIGPLASVKGSKRPLLVGKGSRRTILRATEKVTRLRKGAVSRGIRSETVPLYVGIPAVTIRKKFSIIAIAQRAAARLGELYAKHVK